MSLHAKYSFKHEFCFRDSSFKSSSVGNGDFIVQNDKVKAEFDGENGMIKKATSLVDDKPIDLNSHFVHYGARKARRKCEFVYCTLLLGFQLLRLQKR